MNHRSIIASVLASLLLCGSLTGCGADMQNPADTPAGQLISDPDDSAAQMSFSLNLLRETVRNAPDANVLISPYSAMQALAMTANGADGNTRTEMEQALGGLPLKSLNKALKAVHRSMKESKNCGFKTANAVWVNNTDNNLKLQHSFQKIAESDYNAKITCEPFDESARRSINDWCSEQTDGMIPEILSEPISPETVMYLLNASALDAVWEDRFLEGSEKTCVAHYLRAGSRAQTVPMLESVEQLYLSDEKSEGILKYYEGKKLAFAAIRPDEGMTPQDYLEQVTAEQIFQMLNSPKQIQVNTTIPQFALEYDTSLVPELQAMGMQRIFKLGQADLSGLTEGGNTLFVGDVKQKTQITLDAKGTRAASVTAVEVDSGEEEDVRSIFFNKPFIYIILNTETMTPLFAGILNEIPETS